MIITFLGTSAAHPYPDPDCECGNCRQARLLGGKSIRKRPSLLVNDDLLIDPGPDLLPAAQDHGVELETVRFCLVTHAHGDHLDVMHLLARRTAGGGFGGDVLHLYASAETLQIASEKLQEELPGFDLFSLEESLLLRLEVHTVEPLKPFTLGCFRVIAYPANHVPEMGSLLFSLELDGQAIFYGTDTAALFENTWQAFRHFNLQFDLVILDHTNRPEGAKGDHLNVRTFAEQVQRLQREGLLKDVGRVFATHIEHSGNPPHPELAAFAFNRGYEVAHDGLVIEV